ncbi:MAG: sugar transferase [bacterium]|nr:sugar transferase [bacterium]
MLADGYIFDEEEQFIFGEYGEVTKRFKDVLHNFEEREKIEPVFNIWKQGIKRTIDIVVSLLMIILLLPFYILLVIIIKLDSRGPIFFKQRRAGYRGKVFYCYKFRSMCVDAEAKKDKLRESSEVDGPVFKIKKDPRTTKLGRFIRKTSVDELPQLINVLKGEMSLVGPRPLPIEEVAKFERWHLKRLKAIPGITCIWQVSGRNTISFDDWMRMDIDYIDSWSISLDFKLLLQTIPAVMFGTGAS